MHQEIKELVGGGLMIAAALVGVGVMGYTQRPKTPIGWQTLDAELAGDRRSHRYGSRRLLQAIFFVVGKKKTG